MGRRPQTGSAEKREYAKKRIQDLEIHLQSLERFPNPSKGKIREIKFKLRRFERIFRGGE